MEAGRTEIRLLELLPALASGKPIQCKIHHSFLEDSPTYSAISYCWGHTNKMVPIHIGNCEIRVTINLKDALQHLRHTDTSRFLWADAICINQTDLYERNQQVRIMRDIYINSTITVVWLGK
ncbi:heterokaryon incompatibility protein-domain-containing protein, partial [Tricladium varicosporioides]